MLKTYILLIVPIVTVCAVTIKEKEQLLRFMLNGYCDFNGAQGTADEVMEAIKTSVKCIKKAFNLNQASRSISAAKKKDNRLSAVNNVMNGICGKAVDYKDCVTTMTKTLSQCMSATTREHIEGINKAINAAIDFSCSTNIDDQHHNIALFENDDGFKCLMSQSENLTKCTDGMENNVFWERCQDYDAFSKCVVNIGQACPSTHNPSAGQVLSQLATAARANSPCDKDYKKNPRYRRELALRTSREIRAIHDEDFSVSIYTQAAEMHNKNPTSHSIMIPTASYNNTDLSSILLDINNVFEVETRPIRVVPFKNELEWKEKWISMLDLRSPDEPIGRFRLTAAEMTRYRAMMRKYCKEGGGRDEDFSTMLQEMGNCIRCLRKLIDPKRVKVEIEIARPFGRKGMRKIFVKYCGKVWLIKECIFALTFKAVPNCMADEHENYVVAYNAIIDMTINFWCYQAGDRIALWYANDGPKCFSSKFTEMEKCGDVFEGTVFWKRCQQFPTFLTCVVKAMKECPTPHPHRIVEALLTVIYRRSVCRGGRKKPWITRPPPTEDYNY